MTEERRRRAYDETRVRDIKGERLEKVLHVVVGQPLRDAIDFLASHKIGLALVIDTHGALAGVVSERDVVRAIYEHGGHALDMRVDAFMARDVYTCSAEDRAVEVAKVMAEHRFRHVPIVDDGYLSGMISASDIVKYFAASA